MLIIFNNMFLFQYCQHDAYSLNLFDIQENYAATSPDVGNSLVNTAICTVTNKVLLRISEAMSVITNAAIILILCLGFRKVTARCRFWQTTFVITMKSLASL